MDNILLEREDIADIACFSATSIYNYVRKGELDLEPIDRLIFLMRKDYLNHSRTSPLIVFYETLMKYSGNDVLRDHKVDKAELRRDLFLMELRDVETLSKERLENLGDFCINLSKTAAPYSAPLFKTHYLVA